MNLIVSDMDDDDPQVEDLQYWAETLGLDFPVLADPAGATAKWYDGRAPTKYFVLVDRGMVLDTVGPPGMEDAVERAGELIEGE